MLNEKEIIKEIDTLLKEYGIWARKNREKNLEISELNLFDIHYYYSSMSDTIVRFSPPKSQYRKNIEKIIESVDIDDSISLMRAVIGFYGNLKALKKNYMRGSLKTMEEFYHADIFGDFLKFAEETLNDGYKDPSAVLISVTLEDHLRKLCIKNDIEITEKKADEKVIDKKCAKMNEDLGKVVYNKINQQKVTALLSIRNSAVHAKWNEYTENDIKNMLNDVRDFISRFPA